MNKRDKWLEDLMAGLIIGGLIIISLIIDWQ
jgi:hypothetical protein